MKARATPEKGDSQRVAMTVHFQVQTFEVRTFEVRILFQVLYTVQLLSFYLKPLKVWNEVCQNALIHEVDDFRTVFCLRYRFNSAVCKDLLYHETKH